MNNITINDFVKYLSQILNIDLSDKLTALDMLEDLKEIQDLGEFRIFIKSSFNYERFKFLTGYQKFLALKNEFIKNNKPKLDEVSQEKANSFAYKLYKKTINVFDEVNFLIQEGNDIRSKTISNYIGLSFMDQPKEIQVLELVGKREELLRLCNTDKTRLENKIFEVVERLALIKKYPQLEVKRDKIEVLERLKNNKC